MANPSSNSVPLTNDNDFIDGLTQGSRWDFGGGDSGLTYAFNYFPGIVTFWSDSLKSTVVSAFKAWSNVANIHFHNISSGHYVYQTSADISVTVTGHMLYDNYGYIGASFYPDPNLLTSIDRAEYPKPEGDIFLDNNVLAYVGGGLPMEVTLHEIGHSLGLKEPFSDGDNNRPTFSDLGIGEYDTMLWTVMSYTTIYYAYVATPMPLDILAIQHIYGPNLTYHAGNDLYTLKNDNRVRTIWDAGGTDTMTATSISFGINMDLEAGHFTYHSLDGNSGSSTAIAFGVVIENAIGTPYDDHIVGNSANNLLNGNKGSDSMAGGTGSDTYVVDNLGDTVAENPEAGIDTVQSSVSFSLGDNLENLTLTGDGKINGSGNGLDNLLTGNAAANGLIGGDGNDSLNGAAGADSLAGGLGDDSYVVDNVLDGVAENGDSGTDLVTSSVSYRLTSDVENLVLTGRNAIKGTGNGLDNILYGNVAANVLDGGAGADELVGGLGNDTYVVDDVGDTVTENAGQGADLVKSGIDYTLGNHLENLILLGAAIIGIGNELNNIIAGNGNGNSLDGGDGKDILNGGTGSDILTGGAGIDVLRGNGGNDTFVVNIKATGTLEDTISAGSGIDLLQLWGGSLNPAAVNLTAASTIENYDISHTGSSLLNLIGNPAANRLTGNDASNLINGKVGADTLIGGLGDDSYVVDNPGDTINESAEQGNDTVYSAISFDLSTDGLNVENLTLSGSAVSGSGNDAGNILTGNTLANTLLGHDGNDRLYGLAGADGLNGGSGDDWLSGGSGLDSLSGGAGADIFSFDATAAATNQDTVMDFESGVDKLQFSRLRLTALGVTGQFGSDDPRFWASVTGVSHDADDRIIYNTSTGALSYDSNGTAAGGSVIIELLANAPTLAASDIWVI